ncbi:ABC transporter substrate-binding protein, partial [Halorubrum sp. SP9]
VVSLETGQSDVADGITPQTWQTVQSADNMSLQSEPGISYYYLAFNCNEGPTADPQVREAIDYAVSMDQAVSD